MKDLQHLEDRIEALEAENERLRDQIEMLKEATGITVVTPVEWRLTGKESSVFGALMAREVATKEQIMAACYEPGIDDEPEIKIVDVFVCKIRKKLKPFGISIETRWGIGYSLTPNSKTVARLMMGLDTAERAA